MLKRLGTPTHQKRCLLYIAPTAAWLECHFDPVCISTKSCSNKRRGPNSVTRLAARGTQHQLRVSRRGMARSDRNLSSGTGKCLQHKTGGRLPQPISNLIVERRIFADGQDVRVITQAVKKLRPVQLIVDG